MNPHSAFPLRIFVAAILTAFFPLQPASAAEHPSQRFHSWAQTPPMGWNSWDCFATTINEAQTKAQADYMAANLKAFGWQYLVVDIQWYEPGANGYDYRKGAPLVMDEWGRLLPAPNRFPSAAGGAGFKPLADYAHSLGLKFGIHMMRGIPRLAVENNLPVRGTQVHARDIANTASICPWNPDMYGVDMSKPGAQEYYDSVFEQIASWGVDYVKVDDISRPYHDHEKEIEAIRKAIDRTKRPIVLSLSPGETAISGAEHVKQHANLWRISDDFWDNWPALHEQFGRLNRWNPHRSPGAWPDADMLPFGVIDLGKRTTRFTKDEQYTVMTLWSIARSPLMHGGDMTKMDDFTLSLLTNDEVIAVNQRSENNRPLFDRDNLIGWAADVPGSSDKYVALFNARERISLSPERAVFRGSVSREAGVRGVEIDIDATGAASLVLVADPTADGNAWDHALWIDPRVVMADGSERSLLNQSWSRADAFWSNLSTEKAPGGGPMSADGKPVARGIGAHAPALIEYVLPAGAQRFRAKAALDDAAAKASKGGSVEFRVFLGRPGDGSEQPGLPVEVVLKDLGFSGAVKVRDLWAKKDLATQTGSFAPVIAWHGAGLYRISPTIRMAPAAAGLPPLPAVFRDEPQAQQDARLQWFREARFGMFIHWGVYAVPAGFWQGKPVGAEWIMHQGKIPVADYKAFAKDFTAASYDPEFWAQLAADAGMKYVVITAKHHDGFTLYDSAYSDWNAVKASGARRDLLAPLAKAVRARGLKFGTYYSQAQDWINPGGSTARIEPWDAAQRGDFDAYLAKVALPQVRELLDKFNPDILWWDTEYLMTSERARPFFDLVVSQPHLIHNSRLGGGVLGDFRTSEQRIPASAMQGRALEVNMTINRSWGYRSDDLDYKSAQQLIRNLSDVVSKDGNYLLNVGPTATGEIPAPQVQRLRAIGRWMKINGDSIYATRGSIYPQPLPWGRTTQKVRTDGGTSLYLHIWEWPVDGKILLPNLRQPARSGRLLANGAALSSELTPAGLVVTLGMGGATDPDVSVAALEFDGAIVVEGAAPLPVDTGASGTLADPSKSPPSH